MHKTLIVLLSTGMILGACSTQTFRFASTPGTQREQAVSHFVFGGVGQKREFNAASICGGKEKVARVQTVKSFGNGFLSLLSFGLYTPWTYKVSCLR